MTDKYFPLESLESDPARLVKWLTDIETQRKVATKDYKAFRKEPDGTIMVHDELLLCYRLWFDPKRDILSMGIWVPMETK